MRRFVRVQSLTLAMLGIFAVLLIAQFVTGQREYNQDQAEHGDVTASSIEYLQTGHFIEATFENWESEFLQMGMYVLLTAFLFQRGSTESRDPDDDDEPVDRVPRAARNQPDAPWPVRRGGVVLALYNNSLVGALLLIFAISFVLHAYGGAIAYSEEQIAHGGAPVSTLEFMETSASWFQSFQNWQSEFLAVGVLAVLSVFLRQKGSPESKPVAEPHRSTASS